MRQINLVLHEYFSSISDIRKHINSTLQTYRNWKWYFHFSKPESRKRLQQNTTNKKKTTRETSCKQFRSLQPNRKWIFVLGFRREIQIPFRQQQCNHIQHELIQNAINAECFYLLEGNIITDGNNWKYLWNNEGGKQNIGKRRKKNTTMSSNFQ